MFKKICVVVLASVVLTTANAAVTAVDLDNNGSFEAFLDSSTNLLWSNANTFGALNYSNALSAVGSAGIEGLTDWYIPTRSQFDDLYSSQGSTGGLMNASPFSGLQYTWYWTTDVHPDNSLSHVAFSATDNRTNYYLTTTLVNTWAVHTLPPTSGHGESGSVSVPAIPEPSQTALLLAGLLLLGFISHKGGLSRTRSK